MRHGFLINQQAERRAWYLRPEHSDTDPPARYEVVGNAEEHGGNMRPAQRYICAAKKRIPEPYSHLVPVSLPIPYLGGASTPRLYKNPSEYSREMNSNTCSQTTAEWK